MYTCEIKSHIEGIKSRYAQTVIVGWAVSLQKREIEVRVTCRNQPVEGLSAEWTERPDILSAFFGVQAQAVETEAPFGFRISFPSSPEETYRLTFSEKGENGRRQVYVVKGEQAEPAGIEGIKARLKKGAKRLLGRGESGRDGKTVRRRDTGSGPDRQCGVEEQDPLISIIVPVYRPEPVHFMEMILSL